MAKIGHERRAAMPSHRCAGIMELQMEKCDKC